MPDPTKPVQDVKDFTRLYEQALESPELMDALGNKIAQAMREQFPDELGDVKFSQGRPKTWERAAAKMVDETGKLDPKKASSIVDLIRGRIVVETPEQIQAIRQFLDQNKESLGIRSVKDRFAKPSGTHYRDINLNVELENGHIAEIQINQRDMLAASDFTHDAYEELDAIEKRATLENRDLTPSEQARTDSLKKMAQDIHDKGAAQVPGIDDLLNEDGQQKLEEDYAVRRAQDPNFKPGETIETNNKFGPIIENNPDFLDKAEANGGVGYKTLAKEQKVSVDRLATDPAEMGKLQKPNVPSATIGDKLNDFAKGLGISDAVGDFKNIKNADDLVDAIKGLKTLTNGLKVTKASVIGGVATTAVAAGAIKLSTYMQRLAAEEYLKDGKITQEAFDDYIEMNKEVGGWSQAENIAGQAFLMPFTTGGLEYYSTYAFKDVSHEHNFPEEIHDALNPSMGLFNSDSMSGEFAKNLGNIANTDMKNLPNELNSFWEAKHNLDHVRKIGGLSPNAEEKQMIADAEQAYRNEVALALNDPEQAQMLLSRMSKDNLIEMVSSTAQHNAQGQPPIIQKFAKAHQALDEVNGKLDGKGLSSSEKSALKTERNRLEDEIDGLERELSNDYDRDPGLINAYISDVFGGSLPENTKPAAALTPEGQKYTDQFSAMSDDAQDKLINDIVKSVDPAEFDANTSTYIQDLVAINQLQNTSNFSFESEYDKDNRRVKLDDLQKKYGGNMDLDKYKEQIIQNIKDNPEVVGRFLANSDKGAGLASDSMEVSAKDGYMAELKEEYKAAKKAFGKYGENPSAENKQLAEQKLEALQKKFDDAPDSVHWSIDKFAYIEGGKHVDIYMADIRDQMEEGRKTLNPEQVKEAPVLRSSGQNHGPYNEEQATKYFTAAQNPEFQHRKIPLSMKANESFESPALADKSMEQKSEIVASADIAEVGEVNIKTEVPTL